MLSVLALLGSLAAPPIVSGQWVEAHLKDPNVRVIWVGAVDEYRKGHIPGARAIDHMATVQMDANGHRLASNDALARTLARAGAADGARVILYGDSPMATAWVNSAFAAIGHVDDVSWLDGGFPTWQKERRPVDTEVPPDGASVLTVRPAGDLFVDAAWVRAHLQSPQTKILDVRSQAEWNGGHVPNATLVLWQELFADVKMQKLKSADGIRAVLTKAGIGPDQEIVTYCAIGMRASLMAWLAKSVGIPVKIYLGSWQDWSQDPQNPIVKP